MTVPLLTWRTAYWAAAGLILAGILHIVLVVAAPFTARNTAWQRLGSTLTSNAMRLLPPATPGNQMLPYMAPDVRYAVCRFDLSNGPVLVRSRFLDAAWSLALYTPLGDNFFAMTSADLQKPEIELLLSPPQERGLLELTQDLFARSPRASRDVRDVALSVTAPGTEGLAVLRAPSMGTAFDQETETALSKAVCLPQKRKS